MTNAANDMTRISNDLRGLANSVPCVPDCGFPISFISFSSVRDGILGIANPIGNLASTTIAFKDTMQYGIMTLMVLGIAGIIAGVGLVATGSALRAIEKAGVMTR